MSLQLIQCDGKVDHERARQSGHANGMRLKLKVHAIKGRASAKWSSPPSICTDGVTFLTRPSELLYVGLCATRLRPLLLS